MALSLQKIRNNRRTIIIYSIIILLTALCFYQNLSHQFVNYDDSYFIYQNDNVADGLSVDSFIWAFTSTYMGVWQPISWLSHIVDCELYGLNAGGHHLSSILLHLLNSLLLFMIFSAMTGTVWRSAIVAILFAIHPFHVEPASWIASRKDLLSTFFVFLSIRSYLAYIQNRYWKNYLLVTLFFALALMSKPIVIYLPVLFILLDFWPLDRFNNKNKPINIPNLVFSLIKEKTIWFVMSGLILILNFKFLSNTGTIASFTDLSLIDRITNIPYLIFFYLYKFLYPVSLSVFYPYPEPPGILIALGGILSLSIMTLLFFKLKNSKPYLLFGWFWFLVGLLPVLGLIQQAQHLVADRYMYLPLIGLSIIVVWGVSDATKKIKAASLILPALSIAIMPSCVVLSFKQAGIWENSFTLFENALRITENNHVAHANLGGAYLFEQNFEPNYEQSIYHYSQAIEIEPYYSTKTNDTYKYFRAVGNSQLGNKYLKINDDNLALEHFMKAMDDDTINVANHYNVGNIYLRKKQFQKAISHYQQAIELGGQSPDLQNNIASAQMGLGEYTQAEKLLKKLLKINPEYYIAAYSLARVYSAMNQSQAAVERLRQLVSLGFNNWQLIKNDPALINIRNSKAYLEFLKENDQSNSGQI